jgi:hypothetical protein
VKDTQKDFSDFKVVVAEKYASREEMRMAMESIRESLQRLNDKLDNFIKENK